MNWTARKDRNPTERGSYLTYCAGRDSIRITNFGTSRGWDNGRDRLAGENYKITHWMPLPDRPTSAQTPVLPEGK